jgi:hypothetical protein
MTKVVSSINERQNVEKAKLEILERAKKYSEDKNNIVIENVLKSAPSKTKK